MDNNIFNEINTTLDLNGPILSYLEQPTGATGIGTTLGATGGGSISFSGIATGVNPGTGYISYQWYEVDVGKLSDSTYLTGAASTAVVGSGVTLTLSNLVTPRDNQRKFYLQADYVASAYQQDQLGIAKSTGNAWNEPLNSGIATATVTPLIEIVSQPTQGVQRYKNKSAIITVNADLTDSYFADDLIYQWYLNGEEASDGVKVVSTTTGAVTAGTVEHTYTSPASHQLPAVGISNLEITLSGGSGGNGGFDGGGPGGQGGGARVGRFSLPDSLKGEALDFSVGLRGNDGTSGGQSAGGSGGTGHSGNPGGGGDGGGAGQHGWSGGGGGGGSATYVKSPAGKIIVAGGGAGGGGGSHNRGGKDAGFDTALQIFTSMVGDLPLSSGQNGYTKNGDGGGGGGGGGGSPNGTGTGSVVTSGTNVTFTITTNGDLEGTFFRMRAPGQSWDFSSTGGSTTKQIPYARLDEVHINPGSTSGIGQILFTNNWKTMKYWTPDRTPGANYDPTMTITCSRGTFSSTGRSENIYYSYRYPSFIPTINWGGGPVPQDNSCGAGGGAGQDNSYGGNAGRGGCSSFDSSKSTLISQWESSKGLDGYGNIKYTGYTDTTVTTTTNTTLSGTDTNSLTISCDSVGVQTCQCKITSATASNSPIWTDVTNFVTTSIDDEYNIKIEGIGIGITASLSTINLNNGDYEFTTTQSQVSSGSITNLYSFYSPDKDINVEMDLYGGKGDDQGSYMGGEGGYSRIRFTMVQNTEYIIAGLSTALNSPFVYRKAELIACVGGGGNAGTSGDGGDGGGVSNEGQDGGGRESGIGGVGIAAGTIGSNGTFGSQYPSGDVYTGDTQATGQDGGQTIRCTKGSYWARRGIAACTDMTGTNVFRLSDGTAVTNSALITRGFKAGYNIIETSGAKDANGGLGGNGATGGSGGAAGGGGGGSGYNDGSITVVDTKQGGSTVDAKVILRIVT